jgi:hypothetical protein
VWGCRDVWLVSCSIAAFFWGARPRASVRHLVLQTGMPSESPGPLLCSGSPAVFLRRWFRLSLPGGNHYDEEVFEA